MNAPRVGVGVMIVRDGRVLMGRRMSGQRPGWWGWIGGKLEFGETLQECARREAREEAGVEVTQPALAVHLVDHRRRSTLDRRGISGRHRFRRAAHCRAGRTDGVGVVPDR